MSDEEDERFAHIKNDPRFRSIPKWERKVKIDKRFSSMFHDKRFKLHYAMDKRGRPLQHTSSEDLKKFYDVGSSESESEEADEKKTQPSKSTKSHKKGKSGPLISQKVSEDESSDASEEEKEAVTYSSDQEDNVSEVDLARGEGNVETSSSDDSSEDDEEGEENDLDHKWGELEKGVARSEDVSRRLAVCNLDWDRLKASDLFVLFNNFKPPQGVINSVKIYPSEFGIQRMKEEEVKGPAELTEVTLASDEEDQTETREGSKYHMETLRKYQLTRLKYYYAVVECDSVETATALYNDLDGMEYESSASQFDLRFIPDDMVFEHEPKSMADKLPDMSNYEPVIFITKALQQTMVELTWDENNPDRLKTLEKAFKGDPDDLNDDLKAYLASSSESSEDENQGEEEEIESNTEGDNPRKKENHATGRIGKYKELLASLEQDEKKKKQKDIEMEITWEPGLKDRAENLIKQKQQKEEMTYFQQYLEKKKEAKKQRRKDRKDAQEAKEHEDSEESAEEEDNLCNDDVIPSDVDLDDPFFKEEIKTVKGTKLKKKFGKKSKVVPVQDEKSKAELELLLMDDQADSKKHFNLKHLMEDASLSKRKKKKLEKIRAKEVKARQDGFQINTEDPRFSALFTSADYNIDPSDTHFKKTKAMDTLLQEKQKRRTQKVERETITEHTEEPPKKQKMDPSLSFLIKSVKNKTQNFKRRRN